MDSKQFDGITKSLANPASRRVAVKAAGALGIALTRLTTTGTEARTCRRNGKPCEHDRQRRSKECRRDVCRRDR